MFFYLVTHEFNKGVVESIVKNLKEHAITDLKIIF